MTWKADKPLGSWFNAPELMATMSQLYLLTVVLMG
jgi:hypothetical protein